MYYSPPYKSAKLSDVSQQFKSSHQAVDFWFPNCYGTFLCSPCDGIVWNIVTDEDIYDEFWADFNRGYGIAIKERNENRFFVYWHCLQIFPVCKGMSVKKGQPVAQIGNSGLCYSDGVEVKQEDKIKQPFPGAHLHYEMFELDEQGKRVYSNVLPKIDFGIQIKYDLWTTIKEVLNNIGKLFK